MKIVETKNTKSLSSEDYNYFFNKKNGHFFRWGKTVKDDPVYSPWGPEILDLEASSICYQNCLHCYKSNTANGKNMSFKTYKKIFKKLPKSIVQVAFGVGSLTNYGELVNEDLWKIMEYTRRHGVIPNITINGFDLQEKEAKKLAQICGAVSVSNYNFDVCYRAVRMLSDAGLSQVNIHNMLSAATYENCIQTMIDYCDNKIEGLNAIVFLSLKKKGRGTAYESVSREQFRDLVGFAMRNKIPIGFDSCGAGKFLSVIHEEFPQNYDRMLQFVEPCESTCFSAYINVDGIAFPCSFAEGHVDGVDVLAAKDFVRDVWESKSYREFRTNILANHRNCFLYEV